MLFALKGVGNRPFYRWVSQNYRPLFPNLTDRTRLFRLFETYQDLADTFMAQPSLLGIIDTYGIESRLSVMVSHAGIIDCKQ